MRHKRINANTLICRIDVTGLLSILVVLLFMMMPIQQIDFHGGWADLPKVMHPIPMRAANREDALVFVVQRDGGFYLQHERVQADDVPSKIREAVKRGAERKVYIRADARAKYANVLELLRNIQSAGIQNVAFLADMKKTL